jgi:hypothetical protein
MSTHIFTSKDIIDSIAAWQAIISDPESLIYYLNQGNTYTYDNVEYSLESDTLHAYPGIYDDKLYFFVIPDAYDNEENKDKLTDYVQCRPVMWTLLGTNKIPLIEGEIRIARWIEQYKHWIPVQVSQPAGMFKAFAIPSDDFSGEECLATLGLQIGGVEGVKTADIIVASANTKTLIEYDDFVNPVPPFGAAALESSFYLLQAAASI